MPDHPSAPMGLRLSQVLDGPRLVDRLGESLPGLVYVFDLVERRNLYTNRSLAELLGYSAEQVRAMGDQLLAVIIHPDDVARALAHHDQIRAVGEAATLEIEYRVRDAAGTWRWLHSWESVLTRDAEGRAQQLFGIAQDVTERVETEVALRASQRALRESEQRWRSIAENPFDFVVVIDRAYRYTFVNFVAPGLKLEDLLGKATPFDFVSTDQHAVMQAAFDVVFEEGRATSYEVYIPMLDQWFSSLVGPIREGDVVTHASVLTRDVSVEHRAQAQARETEAQLRRMEAALAQSAKLEAVGRLAGGIAHDFNNLLACVGGVAEMIARRAHPDDPTLHDVTDLREAVTRGAGLTRQLLTFGRQQPVVPSLLDLNLVVDEVARLLRRLVGGAIELQVVTGREPLWVLADRSQLEQVLMNLTVNARDAMPGGGRLTFELSEIMLDAPAVAEHPDVQPGRFVQLVARDDGPGMEAAVLARIFEPFFTTKAVGRGTGLGLATVYGIVRGSGGFIQVRSAPGQGTCFEIRLPRVDAASFEAAPPPLAPAGGSEAVPVVGDEGLVRRLTQQMLEVLGYRVVVAPRGDEALAMIEAGQAFDLLLTDVRMPGLDGHQLQQRAAVLRPGLPVVVMSGYADSVHGAGEGPRFLPKPFSLDALAAAVRGALDARASAR